MAAVQMSWRAITLNKQRVAPIASTKRFVHDLSIRQATGKVTIGAGTGGRSSVSGSVATVFGCTGFLGRYLVSKLARKGTQVIVPFRGESDDIRHLKVTGDLGQVVPLRFDLRNRESIEECVRHSDVVYNLIGRSYETKNFSFEKTHVYGAHVIAEACAKNDVAHLVHVSALNARHDSPSKFLRTKAAGEDAVRNAYPEATIVRPSTIYGHEDRFLNFIAGYGGSHMYVNNQAQRIRPVHSLDVALALETMLSGESTIGKTYELYGPDELTYGQVEEMVYELLLERKERMRLPKSVALLAARMRDLLPWRMTCADEVERMFIDDAPSKDVSTFADLYIEPARLEDTALQFVRNYRQPMYYEMVTHEPPEFRKKKTEKEYHVVW